MGSFRISLTGDKVTRILQLGVIVLLLAIVLAANAGTVRAATPAADSNPYVVNGTGSSNVEKAHAILQGEGNQVYLVLVSSRSTGVEGEIYRDLLNRHFRSMTGPDEGIDTHGTFCYPNCVFVPSQEANVLGVYGWVGVLRHEYRHITPAQHNPNMAQDFRGANGLFTPYAAFSEACADYGLNEAPVYRASYRIGQLYNVLGHNQQSLVDAACQGDKADYQNVVTQYNQAMGQNNAFDNLFPSYR